MGTSSPAVGRVPERLAPGRPGEAAEPIDLAAPEVGRLDAAGQDASFVRGGPMAVVQGRRVHDERSPRGRRRRGRRRGPGRSLPCGPTARPAPRGDGPSIPPGRPSVNPRPRASVQTAGSASWSEAIPPQARDRSPVVQELELGRRGRVIRADRVDQALAQALPEPLAVRSLADRRRALEPRVAVGDLLGGERQVVRAGLDGQRQALRRGPARSSARRRPTTGARCGRGNRTRGRARS